MDHISIPLIVLGGRDRRPPTLPEGSPLRHPLLGYKGIDLRIGDRPLITAVAERWQQNGTFGPIYLAGPAALYRGLAPGLELVDTDGNFGQNLRAGLEAVIAAHGQGPTAVTTCDVLPDLAELDGLLDNYRRVAPCDFWVPQIRVPDDPARLGASDWKPRYRLVPEGSDTPVETLPGHLVIADTAALRLELLYRMFTLAYRTRNRPVMYRRAVIARATIFSLVLEDLRALVRLRPPLLTWEVVRYGSALARNLASGTIRTEHLARLVQRLYVLHSHRRRYPERRGWMPVLEGLSLAKDIDTEEEAREMTRQLSPSP